MNALVTGGAGFIGSHIVDLLITNGSNVTILDDFSTGDAANLNPAAHFYNGSILDRDLLFRLAKSVEYIFHLAALPRIQPSFDEPVAHEMTNVVGTINCIEAAKSNKKLKKLVYSSSSACYGTPEQIPTQEIAAINCLSPYALQKYTAEQYVLILGQRFSIPVVALRYFNVYGPRSFNVKNPYNAYTSVVGIFQHQKNKETTLTITGDGRQTRDFIHVQDVARANLAAALSPHCGECYNVGFGEVISILELAKLFEYPYTFISERKGEAKVTWADTRKIHEHLGWKAEISLRRGMELL